ncbi:MAG: hypothetical protein Q9157_005297 [Trypethelium eluteriae]
MRGPFSISSRLTISLLSSGYVRAVSLPGCQLTGAPQQKTLNNVHTGQLSVPGSPFGLVYASQEDIAFVSLDISLVNSTLGVLNTSTFTPTLINQVPLQAGHTNSEGALGITLTHDGRHVLASAGPGSFVVDVARAVAGSPDAVVGALNGSVGPQMPGVTAIEVTVTLDDEYAFVSQEYGSTQTGNRGDIDVFKLHRPSANGSVSGTAIGYLTLGYEVVGTALSPDGSILYATSENTARAGTTNVTTLGSLSIIDVETLKTDPSNALVSNVTAGCQPVRNIVSSDGKVVWLTARGSNHLLAFNASKLVSDPDDALLASVEVGTSPVGLTFARNESRILTADSNRFNYTNATTGLSVVDVDAALSGKPAVLGRIPTGLFPREFAASPNGNTILVADNESNEVQVIDVSTLP